METDDIMMKIVVCGFVIIVGGLLLTLFLCAFFDMDFEELNSSIIEHFKKLDTRIIIGSKWASGRYEITEIRKEYPETDSEITKKYRIEKDKVTMIYLRDTRHPRETYKYELSEFKKWFRK